MVLPAESLAVMDEATALKTFFCQALYPLVHRMLGQALKFLCLHHGLHVSPLVEGLYGTDFLHGFVWCGPHRSDDDPEGLVLDPI